MLKEDKWDIISNDIAKQMCNAALRKKRPNHKAPEMQIFRF